MESPTKRQLVIALSGGGVFLRTDTRSSGIWATGTWQPLTGTGAPTVPAQDFIVQLGIGPTGTLYLASANGVYSVNLAGTDKPWTRLDSFNSPDHALAVDPSTDGHILYIHDGTVYEHTSTVAKRLLASIKGALTLAISPDGSTSYIAGASMDKDTMGEARLWKYTGGGAQPVDITTPDWKAATKEPQMMAVGAGGRHLYVASPGALVVTGL